MDRVQPDIAPVRPVVGRKGFPPAIYHSPLVGPVKGPQAASVVVVAVGQDGRLHLADIHPQGRCIAQKAVPLAHIHQQRPAPRLHIQA